MFKKTALSLLLWSLSADTIVTKAAPLKTDARRSSELIILTSVKPWRKTVTPHHFSAVTLSSISFFYMSVSSSHSYISSEPWEVPLLQLWVRVPWRMEQVDGWLMVGLGGLKSVNGPDDWMLLVVCHWRAVGVMLEACWLALKGVVGGVVELTEVHRTGLKRLFSLYYYYY